MNWELRASETRKAPYPNLQRGDETIRDGVVSDVGAQQHEAITGPLKTIDEAQGTLKQSANTRGRHVREECSMAGSVIDCYSKIHSSSELLVVLF